MNKKMKVKETMNCVIISKKNVFLLLMVCLTICYIFMQRYELYLPTFRFSYQRPFKNNSQIEFEDKTVYRIEKTNSNEKQGETVSIRFNNESLLNSTDSKEYNAIVTVLNSSAVNEDVANLPLVNSSYYLNQNNNNLTIVNSTHVNHESLNPINFLDKFVELKDIRKSTSNIFFVESRCATEKLASEASPRKVCLNPRQSCAVVSTAAINRGRNVYILLTCPVEDVLLMESPVYIQSLLSYPNVRLVRYNMTEMFRDTPVQGLVARRGMEESSYPVEHASDVLRLTMLWKYGGLYCDMDIVTIRQLDDLKTNFCGLESDDYIGSAILNFEPDGIGHDLLTRALHHINDHFDGSRWTANGPDTVTRLVKEVCNNSLQNLTSCSAFTVFNHNVLYPIYWWDHQTLFDSTTGPDIVEHIKKSSYIVHIWNKQSHPNKVDVGSTQAYGILADEYCPSIYRNCGKYF